MSFVEQPNLNSPYAYPGRHWEVDAHGQPTAQIITARRQSDLIIPAPKPKKRRSPRAGEIVFADDEGLGTAEQEYNPTVLAMLGDGGSGKPPLIRTDVTRLLSVQGACRTGCRAMQRQRPVAHAIGVGCQPDIIKWIQERRARGSC